MMPIRYTRFYLGGEIEESVAISPPPRAFTRYAHSTQ